MTGIAIDVEVGSESAKKSLSEINRQLATLVTQAKLTNNSLNGFNVSGFKSVNTQIASNQIEETFVVPKDIVNEQLGFAAKSLPEIVIEVGKEP